jgi:hypothetical protein
MTSAYIILGADGSDRINTLASLIAEGTDAGDAVRVYLNADQTDADAERLKAAVRALDAEPPQVCRWRVTGEELSIDEPESAPATVFLVTDGRGSPVDQMEILAGLLPRLGWEVARVLAFINCALLDAHTVLTDWFKCCAHFADVALFTRREGLPNANAAVKKFTDAHRAEHNPCLLELVKKSRVENAAAVLLPQARRFSHIFDDIDPLDEMEFDVENLPDEPFEIKPTVDPYFARDEVGRRCRRVLDIREFLNAADTAGNTKGV